MTKLDNAIFLAFIGALLLFVMPSCSSEYVLDSDNMDMTVSIGGDAFAMPLGTTDSLTLSSFMEITDESIVSKDMDGHYILSLTQTFNQSFDVSEYTEMTKFSGVEADFARYTHLPQIPPVLAGEFKMDLVPLMTDRMDFQLTYSFEDALDAGLVRIDSILLDNALLIPELKISSGGRILPESAKVRLVFSVSDRLVIENMEEGKVIFEGGVDNDGRIDLSPVALERIDLNTQEGQKMEFTDSLGVDSLILIMDYASAASLSDSDVELSLSVRVGDEQGMIVPSEVYGLVDMKLEEMYEQIDFSDVPDILKGEDVTLDFYEPELNAVVRTNSTVPVTIEAGLIPYFGSMEDEDVLVYLKFTTPYVTEPDIPEAMAFYSWGKDVIGDLLRHIPDYLDIMLLPYTDTDVPQHHLYAGNSVYTVDGDFVLRIPFSFGEEVSLTVSDTIGNLPDMLGKVLSNSNISLTGEVQSTFPVDLELNVSFLDRNMQPIDIPVTPVRISSCRQESVAVTTPLDIFVGKNPLAEELGAIAVRFRMLPGAVPGIPIGEDSYVYSSLFLEVPGGLTIDLKDTEKQSY